MAEPSRTVTEITDWLALEMVQACVARATEVAKPMGIAVVDPGGNVKVLLRMDGAPLLSADVAQRKAWTAVAWNMPTSRWLPFIKDDPVLLEGVPRIDGLTVLPGGLPIKEGGGLIGGIGVSGSHYSEDADVAATAFTVTDRLDAPDTLE